MFPFDILIVVPIDLSIVILQKIKYKMFVFSFQRSLTEHKEKDNVEKVEAQVDELKGIMVRNIGK